jgi:hypothetical protein
MIMPEEVFHIFRLVNAASDLVNGITRFGCGAGLDWVA